MSGVRATQTDTARRRSRRVAAVALAATIGAVGATRMLPTAAADESARPTRAPTTAPAPAPTITAPPQTGPVPVDPDPGPDPTDGVATTRLGRGPAHQVALAVARRAFPTRAPVVYLARADDPTDALVAGQLTDGPVLLVPRTGEVPAAVRAEVTRLRPGRVIALGGADAVPDSALARAAGRTPTARLGGHTATETAALIAHRAFPRQRPGATAYVIGRAGALDAAAAGQLTRGPVYLAPAPSTPTPVARVSRGTVVVAVGGPAVLPPTAVLAAVGAPSRLRLAGRDRYATAAAVSRHQFPRGAAVVYLAPGSDLATAVVAGSLRDGAVLTVPRCGPLPPSLTAELGRLHPRRVVALGGAATTCEQVLLDAGWYAR